MVYIQNLKQYIDEGESKAEEIYTELHGWPELGREEFRTASLLEGQLKKMGFETRRSFNTGIIADLKLKKDTTMAFRADMDALPIEEQNIGCCRSKRSGMMHACGHDVHMAVLMGFAQIAVRLRELLPCNVRLIFQPDEEGEGGAEELVADGALDGVDQIIGLHVMPDLPADSIGVKYGTVHGESRMFRAEIKGEKAHGAKPHLGNDAIFCGAQFINLCQGIISRQLDPIKGGVLTFGSIVGGDAGNVLADRVFLKGIIRGENRAVCDKIEEGMLGIGEGLSKAFEVKVKLNFKQGYKALVNDPFVLDMVNEAAECRIVQLTEKSMTVDDFSAYLQKVPGAYFFLGCGFEDRENSGLHTGTFRADLRCLRTGIQVLTNLCIL